MQSGQCLDTLAQRNRHLMRLAVHAGNATYSPAMRLLRQTHETHPHYNGYTVAQQSLEYALALLEIGGDAVRAEAIVARTLDFQIRDRKAPTYGNFRWMAHWPDVRDHNAVVFMVPIYYRIWRKHGRRLSPSTRRRLLTMFPAAWRAVDLHGAPWTYTNIFLLKILSWLMLGKVLADERAVRQAADQWEFCRRNVSVGGNCEYNSPCYTAVDLYALAGLWEECPDATWREGIGAVLENFYTEFAANLHQGSACLSGASSRSYPVDYLYGAGLSAVVAYQQFGLRHNGKWDQAGESTPFMVNFAVNAYEVPERIRRIVTRQKYPYMVHLSMPQAKTVTTNFVSRNFTIGSACALRIGHQSIPVFICRATRLLRRTAFLRLDPATGAEVLCLQQRTAVLGRVRLAADPGIGRAMWWLGSWRNINRVFLNGSDWDGQPPQNAQALNLSIEIEGVALGLCLLSHAAPIAFGIVNHELLCSVPMHKREPLDFLVEARDTGRTSLEHSRQTPKLMRFFRHFADYRLTVSANGKRLSALHRGQSAWELDTAGTRALLSNPGSAAYSILHRSPFLTLRRSDLLPPTPSGQSAR